jgi:tetratricopeptide (TPR) repeat protein
MTTPQKRGSVILAVCLSLFAVLVAGPASRRWQRHTRERLAVQCRADRDAGRWDELQKLAAEWAARDPDCADPWLFLAHVAEARGDWPAVAAQLERIPEHDPKALPALVEQAKLYFGQINDPFAGEAACLKILRLEPRVAFAHQRLIQYYAVSMQREKLVAQIRAAIEVEREPPEAYVYFLLLDTLRMANGGEVNEHWLERYPGEEIFTVARAVQIPELADDLATVQTDEAERNRVARIAKMKLLDRLLEKYPTNLEILAQRIEDLMLLGDSDAAADLLARVADSAERDSRFWRYKGWLHETFDETAEAEAAYKRALEIHPLDWSSCNRLAMVYRRTKNVPEVTRLTRLVEAAQLLRTQIKKLPSAEQVTPEILAELSRYAHDCGATWISEALDRRLGPATTLE